MIIAQRPEPAADGSCHCGAHAYPDCVICMTLPAEHRDPTTHRGFCPGHWCIYQQALLLQAELEAEAA